MPNAGLPSRFGNVAPSGQQQRRAARDVERAERCDERRDVETGDEEAVDEADQDSEREGDEDDLGDVEKHRIAEPQVDPVQDEAARHHAAEADDRADREIDPAGDDDESHADREKGVERDMLRHQHEIGRRQKVRRGESEEQEHREQGDERPSRIKFSASDPPAGLAVRDCAAALIEACPSAVRLRRDRARPTTRRRSWLRWRRRGRGAR